MTTHPPFHDLTLKELRAYMLDHRDDEVVFQAYMDRLHAESPEEAAQWNSIKDMTREQFAQLLQHGQT